MDLITGVEGQLAKLHIAVCEDSPPFDAREGDDFVYEALINPEEIVSRYKTVYDQSQAPGTTATDPRFVAQLPRKFDITLLFDGTGVLSNSNIPFSNALGNKTTESVDDQIDRFKSVVYHYDGTKHAPNLLEILWGSFIFTGKLFQMTLTYNLFKPDGTPLRATAACKFVESIEDNMRVATERSESPDLTHIRIVNADKNLPGMANEIYGDPAYYMEVAKVNKLKRIRSIKPGENILFPPISKQSK